MSNKNRTTSIWAAVGLAMSIAISVSAQSNPPADNLTAKQTSTQETRETGAETKPGPTSESKVKPLPVASDTTKPQLDRTEAAKDSERKATRDSAPVSPQASTSDGWQFQFTPYVWMPSLHGTAGVGNRTAGLDESFGDLFRALDFVFMGTFEAHKGKFTVLTDIQYVDVSDKKATPGPLFSDVEANLKNFVLDPEVGYRLLDKPDKGSFVEVVGGARIWHVNVDLKFGPGILPAVEVEGSRNWVDAVAGLRGKAAITQSKKAFVTGKVDLGGGGSKFTYQVFGGAGYNVNARIALIGGYRLLYVNYNKDNFIYKINQRGPIVGFGLRF